MNMMKKPQAQTMTAVIKGGQDAGSSTDEEIVQITLKLKRGDLAAIDRAADERRIARAAFIRQAVFQVIEG